jgi:ferritin-like metal-binding protein YciE
MYGGLADLLVLFGGDPAELLHGSLLFDLVLSLHSDSLLFLGRENHRRLVMAAGLRVASLHRDEKEIRMADKQTVKDLLEDQIRDLYSAEKQLTKAIPKMAKGAHDAALSKAFTNHLKETEEQVARLEEVGILLDIKPAGKKCDGMEGVIKEGAEALEEKGNETVLDLGIIGAGSRVEHYEMAGYLTAISFG